MRRAVFSYFFYLFGFPALSYSGFCSAQETIASRTIDHPCKIPLNVSADSLVNYTLSEYKRRFHKDSLPNSEAVFRANYYDNSRGIQYDEAFKKCKDHLVKKLGPEVFCNYVYLTMNSFHMDENEFILKYYFLLPKVPLDDERPNPWFDTSLQDITIRYRMVVQRDGSLKITYPDAVPDCHGLPDCGIKVTREEARKIAREIGFEVSTPNCTSFYLWREGMDWVLEKVDDMGTYHAVVHEMKINIQTGERSR